ncbi:MAG: type II secretion system protein M [Gammaproteobacteria bacterium]|nr:type II secretion system protein M [Gammaproteobacteria bacterium]
MKAWLAGLEPRERYMVLIGAALLIVLLIYVALWEPLVNKVDDLRASTAKQEVTLAWMRGSAQEARRLRGASGGTKPIASGQSLLSLVDRTAKAGRLGDALKRVQPDGDKKVRVWLEGANFDDLIRWVAQLEQRQGIAVISSVFEAQEEGGRVDGRLVFEVMG